MFQVLKVVVHPNKLSLVVKKDTPWNHYQNKEQRVSIRGKTHHELQMRESLNSKGEKKKTSYCVNNFPLALTKCSEPSFSMLDLAFVIFC